jgi:ribonucleases P/MRP protein subunit RPP40
MLNPSGNVIMVSEGRIGVDDIFSLNGGVLRLSLVKETYEKAGLVGKPARFGGTQGKRSRWCMFCTSNVNFA